ncbi:hypothetical protein QNO07_04080 [Streptomyces sp. 549]|uniref:hypothetical protein n=1 Tax=Streptomyces sp. 549 TaxID=3049076 RepID=UPI0024C39E3B|nr:hypothetical protein [Streptomyces sp. 549]MDK1472613.1 hypothetical protein [Streptomyces sp. 549]
MAPTDRDHLSTLTADVPAPITGGRVYRTLLWAVLITSTLVNLAASLVGADLALHLVCGVVTALSATALVLHGLRGRR